MYHSGAASAGVAAPTFGVWATHGAAKLENAHPHVVGPVAVVHNGIIENFGVLRDELIAGGARFETDTTPAALRATRLYVAVNLTASTILLAGVGLVYATAGTVSIGLFCTTPISGSGAIVEVAFDVYGFVGETAPMFFTEARVNEGVITSAVNDGFFVISTDDDGEAALSD